ncbi:HipA domain-containing protein [Escherichia coli]
MLWLEAASSTLRGQGGFGMLLERFDHVAQVANIKRRHFVSTPTLVNIQQIVSVESSYVGLADEMRRHLVEDNFTDHLRTLFYRIIFIILANNDDYLCNYGFMLMGPAVQFL